MDEPPFMLAVTPVWTRTGAAISGNALKSNQLICVWANR